MNTNINLLALINLKPIAVAHLRGSDDYPNIRGTVLFYQTRAGVVAATQVINLPNEVGECSAPIFAMHIHEGESCSGNESDPFADAMTHYNPNACPHPYHAGDMPPLFGCGKVAFSAFLTDRFSIRDIIGKTVIIHAKPDDFTTQPSGNSGTKIACGVIRR